MTTEPFFGIDSGATTSADELVESAHSGQEIIRNAFDDVPKDIAKYIKEKLKVDQEPGPYG